MSVLVLNGTPGCLYGDDDKNCFLNSYEQEKQFPQWENVWNNRSPIKDANSSNNDDSADDETDSADDETDKADDETDSADDGLIFPMDL